MPSSRLKNSGPRRSSMSLRILARSSRATSSGTLRRLRWNPFVDMRRRAAEIAARYPAVSPDELARASAIVAPQIQEVAELARELSRRWRGAPGLCRQRVCIHPGVVLDRVRPDIGAGRARRSGHAGSPACGGEARWPRDWPGAIGDPVPGRLVAGARVDRLCRSPDVWRAACVSGRGVRRGQSRVLHDGGRRRVDHRESRARTARSHRRNVGCAKVGNGQGVNDADISVLHGSPDLRGYGPPAACHFSSTPIASRRAANDSSPAAASVRARRKWSGSRRLCSSR